MARLNFHQLWDAACGCSQRVDKAVKKGDTKFAKRKGEILRVKGGQNVSLKETK